MIEADCEKFMVEMCLKWPNKFSDEDLKYWFQSLRQWPIDRVMGCMTEYKAHCKFVPKLPEIKGRLAASGATPETKQRDKNPRFVDVVRRQQEGRADDMHDFEVILRYFRQMVRKCGGSESYHRKFRRECISNLAALGCAGAESLAETIFGDPDTFDDAVREAIRHAADPYADPEPQRETEIPEAQEVW